MRSPSRIAGKNIDNNFLRLVGAEKYFEAKSRGGKHPLSSPRVTGAQAAQSRTKGKALTVDNMRIGSKLVVVASNISNPAATQIVIEKGESEYTVSDNRGRILGKYPTGFKLVKDWKIYKGYKR